MMYCAYRNVLGPDRNRAVYEQALALKSVFEPSRTSRQIDPSARVSTVVYDQRLTRIAAVLRPILDGYRKEVLENLHIPAFPVSTTEFQLTAHGDGDFFRRHTDSGSRDTLDRALTFVYYFHAEPKAYSGGEVAFFGPDGDISELEPENDMLLMFDPRTAHEVRPVVCPSGRFEDGRFTVNGWYRRRPTAPRWNPFFDRRVFTAVGSWPGAPLPAALPRGTVSHTSPSTVRTQEGSLPSDLLTLYSDLYRTRTHSRSADEHTTLSAQDFFDRYYSANRPVVLRRAFSSSEAVGRWSPEFFAENYPDVPVEITADRSSVQDYEVQFHETVRSLPLGEFARRVAAADGNDLYLVARNNFFDNPALRHLRDQLTPPEGIIDDTDRRRGSAKLWMGPRGTVTPLHFDEHSILFAQIFGRKQFKLVPSFDHRLVYPRDRYYSEIDPENVDLRQHPLFTRACLTDVILDPGDALLIPAGWWHWVKSLSTSISATFSSFTVSGGNVRLSRR